MSDKLIISISGLRGLVGEQLTPGVALDYGRAFGCFLQERFGQSGQRLQVCMGRDTRPSGPMLAAALTEGLCSGGIDVVDLGVVTTPGVGIMVRTLGCQGGIIITASHNPNPYNGIKLLLDNGMAPPSNTAEWIKSLFLARQTYPVAAMQGGRWSTNAQTDGIHVQRVLAIVDPQAIAHGRYRVVLDSVNGAGGGVGKKLLEALGCTVTAVNGDPTGDFAHAPEPTAAHCRQLCDIVRREKAHIGFAQDPDADRLAIVAADGTYLGEEYTLPLAARCVLGRSGGSTAANLSTSRLIDDVARRFGATVYRTPVGEAHVVCAMMEHHCTIGGEGNGGVIDLRVGPIRDSLVAMALVLQGMAETGRSIQSLADDLGHYVMLKEKFPADPQQAARVLALARTRFPQAAVNAADGYRFDFDDGWLHLRVSNTEPVMRMIVEARDQTVVKKYADVINGIRQEILG